MPDLFNMTKEMNSYFHSLPKSVQSSLVYSGAKANSLADLKQLVNNFKENESAQKKNHGTPPPFLQKKIQAEPALYQQILRERQQPHRAAGRKNGNGRTDTK